ncbi:hypothetical protein V8G54_024305 [Vigna mungo]|uniref:Uncharacterized protein n=1 Tax=Vigna mungo TaxID=3915 RepID=A0AAQ3RT30_VIGMU
MVRKIVMRRMWSLLIKDLAKEMIMIQTTLVPWWKRELLLKIILMRRQTLQERFLTTCLDPQAKEHLKTMILCCPKKTKSQDLMKLLRMRMEKYLMTWKRFQVLLSLTFPA